MAAANLCVAFVRYHNVHWLALHRLKVNRDQMTKIKSETGQDNNGQGQQQGDIPRRNVTLFLKSCRTVVVRCNSSAYGEHYKECDNQPRMNYNEKNRAVPHTCR